LRWERGIFQIICKDEVCEEENDVFLWDYYKKNRLSSIVFLC